MYALHKDRFKFHDSPEKGTGFEWVQCFLFSSPWQSSDHQSQLPSLTIRESRKGWSGTEKKKEAHSKLERERERERERPLHLMIQLGRPQEHFPMIEAAIKYVPYAYFFAYMDVRSIVTPVQRTENEKKRFIYMCCPRRHKKENHNRVIST